MKMSLLWSKTVINKFKEFFNSLAKKTSKGHPTFMSYVEDKRGPVHYVTYNYRNNGYEDIKDVFKVTAKQEIEMSLYFQNLFNQYINTSDITSYDNMALKVADWVTKKTRYVPDLQQQNFEEYWSSPWEMYREINITGQLQDDCDGYAVLIVYIWKLMGIPAYRRFVRAGSVFTTKGKYNGGHATAVYLPYRDPLNFYPIEGSYYKSYTNKLFLQTTLEQNKLYGKTWFSTNEERSYRGDIYG